MPDAIVYTDVATVELGQIDVAEPGPGDVQVRTQFSTISAGTEGWILQNLFTWQPTVYPCVPGYQRVGVIEALGPDVTGWSVGDRVVATRSNLPADVTPRSGAHCALANTPATELYAVPAGVDPVDASGTVVAQVGYNAASRANIEPGDWAIVYGDGLIGQCAAQSIRARGARVMLIGHRANRLQLAAAHSADVVINNHEQDVVETVHQHTDGQPVTVVLDSVQNEAAQREYTPLLERIVGQVVYCGFTPGTVWADMALLQQRELTAHFVSGWTRPRMEATLDLFAAGKLSLKALVTHQVAHHQGPAMYRMHLEKSAPFLGMTLDWSEAQ